jgi:excisionase family DNA binding protein
VLFYSAPWTLVWQLKRRRRENKEGKFEINSVWKKPNLTKADRALTVFTSKRTGGGMTTLHLASVHDLLVDLKSTKGEDATIKSASVVMADGSTHGLESPVVAFLEDLLRGIQEGRTLRIVLEDAVATEQHLLTPDQAAALLGVSRPTIYAWQDKNQIGRADHKGTRWVPKADVQAYQQELNHRIRLQAQFLDRPEPTDEQVDRAIKKFGTLEFATKDQQSESDSGS